MENDKDLRTVIAEKSGLLNSIISRKFGSNPDAAATGGEENQTGGGSNMTMRVTRSAGSNAPGEVVDGKLVDVKALAASAARNDIPATDLLALARSLDPHNEDSIPTTIAGSVTAGDKGLPGQEVSEDNSMSAILGDPIKENKNQLHTKQHPAIQKAVDTDVESQVSDKDPYKTLHASSEIDSIVARAKAVMSGADAIRSAATEIKEHPGAGKVEDGGQGKAGPDADKNAPDSAKTLSAGTTRKDVIAAVRAEIIKRQAKVEGAIEDPVPSGSDAAKTPEESAKTMGDGGTRKAESKDRPVASMPEGKKRYEADKDNRDEEAKSYWKKNKADESRYDKEPAADRPITKELQDKMPKLSKRQELLTRLAGLSTVLAASEDEAARLHLKKQTYKKDKAEDMDYGGAAGRTKSEINKEKGQRSSDTGSLSPMMSRLWSAYGPVKTAADKGYHGEIDKGGDKKKQVAEMQKAVKGMKAEDKGADAAFGGMEKKIEALEADVAAACGVNLGIKSIAAISVATDRLAVIAAAMRDMSRLCKASHMEVKFALEKPHGTDVSNDATKLLEDLGETIDDMEGTIDLALKDLGHPGLKDADLWKKGPGAEGEEGAELPGLPGDEEGAGLPPSGKPEMPEMPDLGAGSKGAVKTAFETEDESVEKVAADEKLSPEQKTAKIAELRAGAKWTAVFTKVASKEDASKADMLSSYWEVVRNDSPILKVSLQDAYPVKTAADQAEAFAWFATKDYGRKLLSSAKFEGLGKTAKVLGLSNVRTAASALEKKLTDEKAYYSKAYGSAGYASELLKEHEKKAAAEKAGLEAKIASLEAKAKTETERNDRLQSDITMRAKAARALELAAKAMAKGMFGIDHKASFVDGLMLGDDNTFKVTSSMIENFKPVAAPAAEGGERKASLTAKDLLKIASRAPGLKTALVSEAAPMAGLNEQLNNMWRKPPTAQ